MECIPRICELRDLGETEFRSAKGEEFATKLQVVHEQVKQYLQDNNIKYKNKADLKKREVNFEVGDLVLAYLRRERFLKREYNKLKFKKIGHCKILRNFSTNSYEIELPPNVGISQTFNVSNLYKYQGEDTTGEMEDAEEQEVDWVKQLPIKKTLQPERRLDKKVYKKTRGQEYFQYLVKSKMNSSMEELMDNIP